MGTASSISKYTDYRAVMAKSSDPAALKIAWNTPIDQANARKIIFSYVDEHECPDVRFTATTMRGCVSERDMRLPTEPTLGIVLHEVAHVIQRNDKGFKRLASGKRDVHGKDFVKILDALVASETAWRQEGA